MTAKMVFRMDDVSKKGKATPTVRWQFNERTFILMLFLLSLSVVFGKLIINYGTVLQQQRSMTFSQLRKSFDLSNSYHQIDFGANRLVQSVNTSLHYEDFINNTAINAIKEYIWFLKALFCGLATIGFTWFIIYKDSNVPGINPPSPFSPTKNRTHVLTPS